MRDGSETAQQEPGSLGDHLHGAHIVLHPDGEAYRVSPAMVRGWAQDTAARQTAQQFASAGPRRNREGV